MFLFHTLVRGDATILWVVQAVQRLSFTAARRWKKCMLTGKWKPSNWLAVRDGDWGWENSFWVDHVY